MSTASAQRCFRARLLAFGLLLLAVPACGLSDYEALMREAQEREKRFREEQSYLDKPVEMPTRKVATGSGKEDREEPVANVFIRPPKGIELKPQPEPRANLMWQYRARSTATNFTEVEMAFGEDDKDFAGKVVGNYGTSEQTTSRSWQFTPPGQDTALVFDTWEFGSGSIGYSINILRGPRPIAVVYIYNKGQRESALKAIEVSLQTLAVTPQQVAAARERFRRPTPWRLEGKSGS